MGLAHWTKIYKVLNHVPGIKGLSKYLRDEKLDEACKYYFSETGLGADEVLGASVLSSVLIFVLSITILIWFNLFFSIILSLFTSVVGYVYFKSRFTTLYEGEKMQILFGAELAFQDFLFTIKTNQSVLDGIVFVANASYPLISKSFREILGRIKQGEEPETLLWAFAERQPSEALRDRLVNLLSNNFKEDLITDFLEMNYVEKQAEYKKTSKQLEGKLIVVIGLFTFIPFFFTLFVAFYGLASNVASLLFIPITFFIFIVLRSKFLKPAFHVFGEIDVFSGKISRKQQKSYEQEFKDLLNFLTSFANSLRRNNADERACFDAIANFQGGLRPLLVQSYKKSIRHRNSFEDFWKELLGHLKNPHSKKMVEITQKLLPKSSRETGARIISLIAQVKINQEITEERNILLKAQHFKVQLICVVIAGLLGAITALAPLLSLASQMMRSPLQLSTLSPLGLNLFVSIWPLLIYLAFTMIFAPYYLCSLVSLKNPLFMTLTSLVIFLGTLILVSMFIYPA